MNERSQLIDKLTKNRQTREAYIRSKVYTNVASQLRAVRRREDLTQEVLANISEMKQSRISAMERPGTRWNIETLIRLVASLRIGLVVKLASFSEMLDWENGFSQDAFDVITIDKDVDFRGERKRTAQAASQPDLTEDLCASSSMRSGNVQDEEDSGALESIGRNALVQRLASRKFSASAGA